MQIANNPIITNSSNSKITGISASSIFVDSTYTTFRIEIFGENLNVIDYLETEQLVDGSSFVYSSDFTERTNNKISFKRRVSNGSYFTVNVTGRAKGGVTTNMISVLLDSRVSKPKIASSIDYLQNNESMNIQISYDIENYKSNYIVDLSIGLDCWYAPTGKIKKDCSQYLFDISGAGSVETYLGVKADPYISGGSSNRFVGKNGGLNINSYPNPNFYPPSNMTKNPTTVTYTLKIVDINNGSVVDTVNHVLGYKD